MGRASRYPDELRERGAIEDFVFDHQPGLKRDTIAHLATGAFLAKAGLEV